MPGGGGRRGPILLGEREKETNLAWGERRRWGHFEFGGERPVFFHHRELGVGVGKEENRRVILRLERGR